MEANRRKRIVDILRDVAIIVGFAVMAWQLHLNANTIDRLEAERTVIISNMARMEGEHIWYNMGLQGDQIRDQLIDNNTRGIQDNLALLLQISEQLRQLRELLPHLNGPAPQEQHPMTPPMVRRNPKISA